MAASRLGPYDHPSQFGLELVLECAQLSRRLGTEAEELIAIPLEDCGATLGAGLVRLQEAECGQEVGIVILSAGLVAASEHLIGRGREEEDPGLRLVVRIVEQISSEATLFVLGVEQVFKPLELIENDEIRLQGLEARLGEQEAEVAHQLHLEGQVFRRTVPALAYPRKPATEILIPGAEINPPRSPISGDTSVQVPTEAVDNGRFQLPTAVALDPISESLRSGSRACRCRTPRLRRCAPGGTLGAPAPPPSPWRRASRRR